MHVLGADTQTDPFVFTITVSAGSLLIGTILGIWLNDRRRKRKDEQERRDRRP